MTFNVSTLFFAWNGLVAFRIGRGQSACPARDKVKSNKHPRFVFLT